MKLKKFKSSIIWIICFCLIYSIMITILSFILLPINFASLLLDKNINFLIFIINFLPVILSISILGIIFNNFYISSSITSFLTLLGSVINRYKIMYRDEPFTFGDLQVYKEALNAVSSMNYNVNILLLVILFIFSIIPLLVGIKFERNKINRKFRIISLLSLILITILLNIFIYSNSDIYDSFKISGSEYRKSDQFKSKGFIYSFIYNLNIKSIEKPSDYTKDEVKEIISQFKTDYEIENKPNIIFVLSESFIDPSIFPNIELDKNDYVLKNYEKIKKESIFSGNVIVNGFGGGTAYSEFQALTGMNPELLSIENPFEIIKWNIHCIPTILKQLNYKSIAMHPGQPWFYNRQNAYKYLGFDQQYFIEYYDKPENYTGYYISEKATFEFLMENIKENIVNNTSDDLTPYFYNVVTIQNHGPYIDKYIDYPNNYVKFKLKEKVSDDTYNAIKNYLFGLKDCDIQIGVLTEYLNSIDQPFILVYYGDHFPYLGEYTAYQELGLNKDNEDYELLTHLTPYFIWANKSAKKMIDKEYVNSFKETECFQLNYLPVVTFNSIGFNKLSAYFSFINELFKQFDNLYTVLHIDSKNNDFYEMIKNWSSMQYYYLREKNIEE